MKKWLSNFISGIFKRKSKLQDKDIVSLAGVDYASGSDKTVVTYVPVKHKLPENKISKKLRRLYYLSTRVKPRVKKKIVKRIIKLKKLRN